MAGWKRIEEQRRKNDAFISPIGLDTVPEDKSFGSTNSVDWWNEILPDIYIMKQSEGEKTKSPTYTQFYKFYQQATMEFSKGRIPEPGDINNEYRTILKLLITQEEKEAERKTASIIKQNGKDMQLIENAIAIYRHDQWNLRYKILHEVYDLMLRRLLRFRRKNEMENKALTEDDVFRASPQSVGTRRDNIYHKILEKMKETVKDDGSDDESEEDMTGKKKRKTSGTPSGGKTQVKGGKGKEPKVEEKKRDWQKKAVDGILSENANETLGKYERRMNKGCGGKRKKGGKEKEEDSENDDDDVDSEEEEIRRKRKKKKVAEMTKDEVTDYRVGEYMIRVGTLVRYFQDKDFYDRFKENLKMTRMYMLLKCLNEMYLKETDGSIPGVIAALTAEEKPEEVLKGFSLRLNEKTQEERKDNGIVKLMKKIWDIKMKTLESRKEWETAKSTIMKILKSQKKNMSTEEKEELLVEIKTCIGLQKEPGSEEREEEEKDGLEKQQEEEEDGDASSEESEEEEEEKSEEGGGKEEGGKVDNEEDGEEE